MPDSIDALIAVVRDLRERVDRLSRQEPITQTSVSLLNVNTTGAATGEIKASGVATLYGLNLGTATGAAAGSLNASGNVGIGTAPSYKLDVRTSAAGDRAIYALNSSISGGYGATIYANGAGAGTNYAVYASASGGASNYAIYIEAPVAGASNYAIYSAAAAKSRFSGNVGIGTDPVANFHIYRSTTIAPSLTVNSDAIAAFNSGGFETAFGASLFGTASCNWIQSRYTATGWGLQINPLGGNVGIGRGAVQPDYALDVTGDFRVSASFGCNTKNPQVAFASGGALAARVNGTYGMATDAGMQALYNLVVNIRAALVADGIMS